MWEEQREKAEAIQKTRAKFQVTHDGGLDQDNNSCDDEDRSQMQGKADLYTSYEDLGRLLSK